MRDDDDAAAGEPKLPDYGTPTGPDAALPLYGSSDSVVPVESSVADFDPKAEQRKKARAARAAAAARTERARRLAREAKAAAAARANQAKRETMLAHTRNMHTAAARRRAERTLRSYAAPPARLVAFYNERKRRREKAEAELRRASAIAWRRARIAGAIAAAVLVVGGIATVVVLEAIPNQPSARASDLDWSTYPGDDSTEFERITRGPSQEDTIATDTALLEDVRAAISEEEGLEWAQHGSDVVVPRENAWNGPSMLNNWRSAQWYSTNQLTSVPKKQALVNRVRAVLKENGYTDIALRNTPARSGGDDELLETLYGGTTLEEQVVWVLGANRVDGSYSNFELRITDLSRDTDGTFAERAQLRAKTGEIPVNSIAIKSTANLLLPADERDEFIERAEPFEAEQPPPAL